MLTEHAHHGYKQGYRKAIEDAKKPDIYIRA